MTLLEAYQMIQALDNPVVTVNTAAAVWQCTRNAASQKLGRLARKQYLIKLKHGLWCFPGRLESFQLPEYIAQPFPAYVSLQSALFAHGMISQVPSVIYAVSLARTRRYETPLGVISLHHVVPEFFAGFDVLERGIKLATPEKALVDFLYLYPAKSNWFKALPELESSAGFDRKKAQSLIALIPDKKRRTFVNARFEKLAIS